MWNEREREWEVAAKKLAGEDDDAQVEMALGLSLGAQPKLVDGGSIFSSNWVCPWWKWLWA